jgi:glucose/arabinose dehydrogenase
MKCSKLLSPGICLSTVLVVAATGRLLAQGPVSLPRLPLPDGPLLVDTAEAKIRATIMKGLAHPWSLAFLPNGDILVTERNAGRLRIVRNGVLDPQPISGVPMVYSAGLAGLMEVVLHPRFADNRLVYLSYIKGLGGKLHTPTLVRGRLEGMALVDVKELFVADTPGTGPAAGAAMAFGPDGHLYMVVGGANDAIAQRTNTHQGKILRFRDDGSVPPDNPFVGKADSKPEIWSIGHRNMVGLTVHPETGAIWESENGPQGGDEINIIKKGANYGWPIVSFGRQYEGPRVSLGTSAEGLEPPHVVWIPSIAASGLTFYTGDRFPSWRRNLFVGGLQFGRIAGTGQLHRIVFNANWEEIRRESLFLDLRQRIRNVRQGPDGLLYVLTDEDDGALLKIEPAN